MRKSKRWRDASLMAPRRMCADSAACAGQCPTCPLPPQESSADPRQPNAAACGVRAPGARHALSAALVACRRRRTHLAASFGPLIRRLGPQAGLSHNNQRDPPAGISGATLDGGEDLPPPLYTYSVYFIRIVYTLYFMKVCLSSPASSTRWRTLLPTSGPRRRRLARGPSL